MENVKEYIESGTLELYVLGDISATEKAQVEEMATKYPEIRAEIIEIERSMEFYAEEHAVEPSENLRAKVLNSLLVNLGDDNTFSKARTHQDDDNVRSLPAARVTSFYKYAFAACLTLFLISVYGLVNLYSKLQESNTQLSALQTDKIRIANQVSLRDNELQVYRDTAFKVLKLKGTAKAPTAAMVLAWNSVSKKVMVAVASVKLPQHDEKHQYQLWALVNGKPVDMGVFDQPKADTVGVKEMKAIASAQGFAVTLEPNGGSINPSMDQMVVIGTF
ncbi:MULTISPECIES: anti-sigma factor [unclassified Mucilaginibacter]|uniref:anti-sigma factor n=1 Tax=unclassified Mucilaginibacter TaxID=2617802 RepID=UPI002AC9B48C|nr:MULTISPECIES: anti-sigma factor [unclassified Mucilaginibacter]MEB0262247.1 anti-sigma factor [Mucilaginibacter sp. 10I4]MEB0278638.1 anti-sigma factor [Mucilaginibacter sp. 10B2]MEB0299348.1 anti-sigma factor [Mucilaginibacter sp. 5C4]WPX23408.1 anti-sigma factor [Mucilaginibacter sp. 5C4]